MKKIFTLMLSLLILCTGCSYQSDYKSESVSADESITITDFIDETQHSTSCSTILTDSNDYPNANESAELLPPNEFDNGKATIENIVSPWTEEKVNEAWKMSWLSENFTSYYDRCFADLDGDGVQELLLTVNSAFFFIAGYKIDKDEIQYLDTANFGGPIGRARLALPPTDEETLSSSNSVYIKPDNMPYEYDMWDLNMTADKRDFRIRCDNSGNNYFTGYVFSSGNAVCWVIKLEIQENKLVGEKVYEWGYYGYGRPGFELEYYAIKEETKTNITKEEIDDFLALEIII